MFVEWKVDVFTSTGSVAGSLPTRWASATDYEVSLVDVFKSSYRSIDRNANVFINSKAIAELTRSATYAGLFSALSDLSRLDEEDPAAIDADTFGKANTVLSLLASRSADPPKIFSHGGDAAVFSWTDLNGMKYITVSGGCAVFARREKGSKPLTVGIADMTETNSVELLPYFGVIRDGASTNSVR